MDQEGNKVIVQPSYPCLAYNALTLVEHKEILRNIMMLEKFEDLSNDDTSMCKHC